MKSFRNYIKEAVRMMSPEEAMRVLGLTRGFSAVDLKVAYRAAAQKAHPDRPGGSTEKMAQVNNANDALQGRGTTGASGSSASDRREDPHEWWVANNAKEEKFSKVAQDSVQDHIQPAMFQRHFEQVFETSFTVEQRPWHRVSSSIATSFTFSNADRTIVAQLNITVDFRELMYGGGLKDPDPNKGLTTFAGMSLLYNRKKIRLGQREWKGGNDYRMYKDPEILFPTKTLDAQKVKTATRKLSKRDVLLTFEKELRAKVEYSGPQIWVYVPIGDAYTFVLYRTTIMGSAAWSVSDLYVTRDRRRARIGERKFTMWNEDAESMTRLFNGLKKVQAKTLKSDADVISAIQAIVQEQSAYLEQLRSK